MNERGRAVFLVVSADDEKLLRLGLWALTAASVGEMVDVLLTAAPLKEWVSGSFGEEQGRARAAGEVAGVLTPREMLRQAKELAPVRIVTCDTEMRLAGLSESEVRSTVDEIVSLPAFWREAREARLITL